MSLAESAANVAVGFGISLAVQAGIFALYGMPLSWAANITITLFYTALSLIRGFAIRRAFESLKPKGEPWEDHSIPERLSFRGQSMVD